MTEPTDGEIAQLRRNAEYHRGVACMVNADAVLELFARIDLERNRADELERAMEANIATLESCGEELNAAEAEVARLRAYIEKLQKEPSE